MVVRLQGAGYASIDSVKEMQRRGKAGRRDAETRRWGRRDSLGSCWFDCDPVAGRALRSSTTEGGASAKATATVLGQAGRRAGCTSSSR